MIGFGNSINWGEVARENMRIKAQQANSGAVAANAQARSVDNAGRLIPGQIAESMAATNLRNETAAQIAPDAEANRLRIGLESQGQQIANRAAVMPFNPMQFAASLGLQTGDFSFFERLQEQGAEAPTSTGFEDIAEPEQTRAGARGARFLQAPGAGMQQPRRMGFAKGTARVPGKGSPKKDTVPAKLAPGEAVLNKAAADALGRGLISVLNAQGAQQMGLI